VSLILFYFIFVVVISFQSKQEEKSLAAAAMTLHSFYAFRNVSVFFGGFKN